MPVMICSMLHAMGEMYSAHFMKKGAVALFTKKLLKRVTSMRPGMATCSDSAADGAAAATTYNTKFGSSVVVREYSSAQIYTANREFQLLLGTAIASLVFELFGMLLGHSLVYPLHNILSAALHAFGALLTFLWCTDGWYYRHYASQTLFFCALPAFMEVSLLVSKCVCTMNIFKHVELRL